MRTAAKTGELQLFLGSLSIIAFIINASITSVVHPPRIFTRPEPIVQRSEWQPPQYARPSSQPTPQPAFQPEPRPEREIAALRENTNEELAAAQHARFLARYLNRVPSRKSGTQAAVVAMSENGRLNNTLAAAIAKRLQSDSITIDSTLFSPEFLTDGLFNNVYGGSSEAINKLDLKEFLDTLMLSKQSVRYTRNPSLENVITATMELEIMTLSVATRGQSQTSSFIAAGAGFSQAQARAMAEERLMKQIQNASSLSLTQ